MTVMVFCLIFSGFPFHQFLCAEEMVVKPHKLYLPFDFDVSQEAKEFSTDGGRVWGGLFLIAGITSTAYGFINREIHYNEKSIEREEYLDGEVQSNLYFTLYEKTTINPQTALCTSLGLFFNSSYWLLKDRVANIDLEEYSPAFREDRMALYSMIFGSLVIASSFMVPEYVDEQRRGYEVSYEADGRSQIFPIQDETRKYSIRQHSVNVSCGAIYIGFGAWKYWQYRHKNKKSLMKNADGKKNSKIEFSCIPLVEQGGLMVNLRF